MGTVMLSVLAGHWRSAHINAVRGDGINSGLLGMNGVVSEVAKPLYGHQQGAAVGYNPQKPGRPSHVCRSYFVANLRISLGVEVRPGNEHAAAKGLPGLWKMLGKLPRLRHAQALP